MATKLTSRLLLHEVVDEVLSRPHPDLRGHLQLEVTEPLGRHEAAVGDAAGEPRALGPEQGTAHGRVDAVGPDQQIHLDPGAVVEPRLDAIPALGEAREAVADVHAVVGQRADERREHVGTVHLVVREAERLDDRLAERGPQQRAAVVPAALVPRERAHTQSGQLVGQAEPVRGSAKRSD